MYLVQPLSRLNHHQDCMEQRSKLNSSRYSDSPNKNPFGFANECVNEMIVISDSKSKENVDEAPVNVTGSKKSDLQMYQAQLR